MIPGRLLLRAATVLALTRGGAGPFPTMAGEAVFDSKLTPVMDIAQEAQTPIGLVYTGEEKRRNLDTNGSALWCRNIDLIIEIAIGSFGKNGVEWVETDAELEALLDFFELEVEAALSDLSNPWAAAWRKLVRKIEHWDSEPFRSSEQNVRYAVRQIVIGVEINNDCLPRPTIEPVRLARPATLDVPYLSGLTETLKSNPVFESTWALLSGVRDLVQFPQLKTVAIKGHYGGPSDAPPNVEVPINLEPK